MKITITQDDIDKGDRKSCYNCPIALGANRAFGDKYSARVENTTILIGEFRRSLPEAARRFVKLFDAGDHVDPFEFEL